MWYWFLTGTFTKNYFCVENILPICHTHTLQPQQLWIPRSLAAAHTPHSSHMSCRCVRLISWPDTEQEKTRQTHCRPLCMSWSQVWVSDPSRRHRSNPGNQCVAAPTDSLTCRFASLVVWIFTKSTLSSELMSQWKRRMWTDDCALRFQSAVGRKLRNLTLWTCFSLLINIFKV